MSIQENCRVVANTRLGEGLYALTMHAPAICAQAQCGQFVHIACGEGNLLRRPISICGWQGDALRVVFQTKGEGRSGPPRGRPAMCWTYSARSATGSAWPRSAQSRC